MQSIYLKNDILYRLLEIYNKTLFKDLVKAAEKLNYYDFDQKYYLLFRRF